jgi:hypothetical protein
MELKSIQRAGSFLELCILVTVVWCSGFPRLMLAGVLYLIAATYLSIFCVFLATSLRTKQRRGTPEPATWFLHRRAYLLLLFAWELAIVGWLNIQAFVFAVSPFSVILSYLSVGVFIFLSYKMVALADSSKQDGGSIPLNYFGRPRPRWMFFCGFVYTPIGPLIIMSLFWSGHKWCPTLLQPPQIWLLLLALLSAMSMVMVFQRYRRAQPNRVLAIRVIVPTMCGLACTAALQVIFAYNVYVYLLSSTTVACIAATVYGLLLAKEGGSLGPDSC